MNAEDHRNDPALAQTAAQPFGGRRLGTGRYTVLRQLGRGGMGTVWLARDTADDQFIALKFLPQAMADDAAGLANLRRESRHAERLEHPHIVRVQGLHEHPGEAPFLVMEYVDGPTINQLRAEAKDGFLKWEFLAPLAKQLCDALACAHAAKVIHRDLKPANLMLDSTGCLKLADFGIAAVVSDTMSRITGAAFASGTTAYMSPQQVNGELPRVTDDIYSAGATLFELLTGTPPFFSGELVHQVLNKPAPSLQQRLADLEKSNPLPKQVEDAIMACLDKNPSKRPQSAVELAEKLGLVRPVRVFRFGPRQAVMAGLVALALVAGISEWARQKHDSAAEIKTARVVGGPAAMDLGSGHTLLSEDFQTPDETGLPAGWSWGNLAKRTTGFPAWSETRRDGAEQVFVRIAGVDEREAAFVERRVAMPFGIQHVRVTARMRPTGVPPPNPALESAAGFVCLWERSAPLGFSDSVAGYAVVESGAGWNDYTLTLTNVPTTARALTVRLGFNLATGILDVAHVKVEAFGDLEKIRRSAAVFAPQFKPLFFEDYEEANAQGNPTRWGIKIVDPNLEFAEHSGILEEGGRKFFRQTPGANQTNLWMNEAFPFKPSGPVVEFSALYRLKNVRSMNEDGATMRPLKVFFRNDEATNLSVYQLLWFDLGRPVNTDWTRLTRRLAVPPGTTQIRLLFGFQNASGTFDVDDVQVRVLE